MPISLTNVMQWNGSAVAIIFAIATIIEVLVVGAHTTLFGALMVAVWPLPSLAGIWNGNKSRRAQQRSPLRPIGVKDVISQAIAQNHQGPRNLGGTMRALVLLPREALTSLRQQALPAMIRAPRLSRPVVRGVNRAVAQQGPPGFGYTPLR